MINDVYGVRLRKHFNDTFLKLQYCCSRLLVRMYFRNQKHDQTFKDTTELAGNKLSGFVSISILIKCGEWVVYAKRGTYVCTTRSPFSPLVGACSCSPNLQCSSFLVFQIILAFPLTCSKLWCKVARNANHTYQILNVWGLSNYVHVLCGIGMHDRTVLYCA